MNKILITGGAGFIGSHLSKMLVDSGHSVRIMDSLSPQIHGSLPQNLEWINQHGIEFVRDSITNRTALEEALQGVDCIVHLAAETGTGQSMYQIERYNHVNSQGTALLCDILVNSKDRMVRKLILASSRSIYGEGAYICSACSRTADQRVFPRARSAEQLKMHSWQPLCPRCGVALTAVPTKESDPVNSASIYAASKYAQEELIRIACESIGIDYSILRLQNVYGEGQSLHNPYTGILSIFSTKIRNGTQLSVFEDGNETRDFVHVQDVANVMRLCLEGKQPINKIMNVGSGVATSIFEVAEKLTAAFNGVPNIRISKEYRIGDIRHNFADISEIRNTLDYIPSIHLDEGLRRFASWVLTQPIVEDKLAKANAELKKRNLIG